MDRWKRVGQKGALPAMLLASFVLCLIGRFGVALSLPAASQTAASRDEPLPSRGQRSVVAGAVQAGSPLQRSSTAQLEGGTVLPPPGCPTGPAVEKDGQRRLALVIGVGKYRSPRIRRLSGPPADARRLHALLTGPGGYGFPAENVCVLLDEDATVARFKEAFDKALLSRARKDDVVVFYFAGHGSKTRDLNGDEPDEWDETLLFHDARSGDVGDLVDDELNGMLAKLYQKTTHVTVILDSCSSGSVTRDGIMDARYEPPAESARLSEPLEAATRGGSGDGDPLWAPTSMPGLVVLSAAADGTSALERSGEGVFTGALLNVLGRVGNEPLTYAQVARQVPPLVAAVSGQIPYFQGALDTYVFGNRTRARPLSWEISAIRDGAYTLRGVPLPGWSAGAEVRVYDGSATQAITRDPGRARATLELVSVRGLTAEAVRVGPPGHDGPSTVKLGDLAVLVRPGDDALRLKLRLRPSSLPGGIPEDRAALLRRAIQRHPDTGSVVEIVQKEAAFELSLNAEGRLQLIGPENHVRNTYTADRTQEADKVARNLWQHARQAALLRLEGETGGDFENNKTLEVQLVPADRKLQSPCATGEWIQAPPNQEQVVPLCHKWHIKVRLSEGSPRPLLIGGLIMSSDGSTAGFPVDKLQYRLEPGKSMVFTSFSGTGKPPMDTREQILVFGTPEHEPVTWRQFTDPVRGSPTDLPGGLAASLNRYLAPVANRADLEDGINTSTWTSSYLSLRVEANSRFLAPLSEDPNRIEKREYTIPGFDIRPYLPDTASSALHRVLKKEDWLANYSSSDGIRYRQHDWSGTSDEENLKRGIDCSRAIWFAFTRAGLRYNKANRYLSTAEMAAPRGPMADEFESCLEDPALRSGDVLVYRDEVRKVGHTVMVIDPEKRIAWGSHGWDGNRIELKKGLDVLVDTGVEYQLIKYKKDWARWDLAAMQRVACWRYRAFREESQGAGPTGTAALAEPCNPRSCPGSASGTHP